MLKERRRLLTIEDTTAQGGDCTHCGLCPQRYFRPVPGYGNRQARLILVGEAPGANEVSQLTPFVGESGQLLDATFLELHKTEPDPHNHLTREDMYVTNAVLCRPPDNRDPLPEELAACNRRLRNELLSLPNRRVIVALGTYAAQALWQRKAEGVTKLLYHDEWSEEFSCHIVYALHPAACLRNPDNFRDLLDPLRTAIDLLEAPDGPPEDFIPPYVVETATDTCLTRLDWIMQKVEGVLACDIETAGKTPEEAKDWKKGWITQIGFWNEAMRKVYLLPSSFFRDVRVLQHLKRLFLRTDLRFLWHYGQFDVQFLRQVLGVTPRVDEDTLLLHYCLDERPGGKGGAGHSLKTLAAKYCKATRYALEKDDFTDPVYHAKDCWYTLEVYKKLLEAHEKEPVPPERYHRPIDRYRDVLIPAINRTKLVEAHGMLVDGEYLPVLKKQQEEWLDVQERKCQHLAGVTFPRTRKQKVVETQPLLYGKRGQPLKQRTRTVWVPEVFQEPINIRSNAQLRWFLYDHLGLPERFAQKAKSDDPTVNKEALTEFRDQHPFIRELLAYRDVQKDYSNYTLGAEKALFVDGRVHTHFSLSATVTGRPASSDINLQNVPKKYDMRRLYIVPPDCVFMEADYSNQEVRIAALLARSKMLREALTHGDYHMEVAKGVFAREFTYLEEHQHNERKLRELLEHHMAFHVLASAYYEKPLSADITKLMAKALRVFGKAVTFGIFYGQKAKGLADRIEVSEEAADTYIKNYLGRFPDIVPWRTQQMRAIVDPGFVATPFGHYRRFPLVTERTKADSIRQALNAPIQSCASDGTMLSLIKLEHELRTRGIGYPVLFVHDSIEAEIKKSRVREGARLMHEIMEHAYDDIMRELDFFIDFPVEVSIGNTWGDMLKKDEEDPAEEQWFARHPEYAA